MGVGSLRLEFQVVDLPYMGARNHLWVLWEQVRLIKEPPLQPYGSVCGYSPHHSWSWFNGVKPRREGETPRRRDGYGDGVKRWCREQERCTQPLGMEGAVSKIPSLGNKDRTPAYEIVKKQLKCQIKEVW